MKPECVYLFDLNDRIEALHQIRSTPNFEPLAASFKRIKNIIVQQAGRPTIIDQALLRPGPEKELNMSVSYVSHKLAETETYQEKLAMIATLRPQVDLFFDKILVNDPDPAIRENRLALLHSLLTEFSTIADFSEIVTQGESK